MDHLEKALQAAAQSRWPAAQTYALIAIAQQLREANEITESRI